MSHPPQLAGRTRYWFSEFAEPDKPVDLYNIYLAFGDPRFVITFKRDG